MEALTQIVITSATTVLAGGGFWAWLQRRDTTKSATTRLMMGLAYDKLTTNGLTFIERGWVTKDEFEDYQKYLYEPYRELGGNGVAERIMLEVSQLPLKPKSKYADIVQAKKANQGESR